MTQEELCKELNGLEVTWIGALDVRIPAIILADIKKGVSVKPLPTPRATRRLFLQAGWSKNLSAIQIERIKKPDFCLTKFIAPFHRKFFSELEQVLLTKEIDGRPKAINLGINPSCPFV